MKRWGWLCAWLFVGLAACSGKASSSGQDVGAGSGGAPGTSDDAPWWTLPAGSRYFARVGRQAPIMLRNISAGSVAEFIPLFEAAQTAGAQAVRVQLTQGFGYDTLGMDAHGAVLASWAASWDAVFDAAKAHELAVIPVFGIWGDWNDGTPMAGWTHFAANPLNQARGGPAASPADLFTDSATQRSWLAWLSALVDRWQAYPNVIAWEIFSELDLATGSDEASATSFAERASVLIRAHDPAKRPVLASTSDLPMIMGAPWLQLWTSPAIDLVSIHPYDVNLDVTVAERVEAALRATAKPVFIGESGLDAAAPDGSTLTSAPAARAGLQQAVWTELSSGAATARALYWEDGYAAYFPQTGLPLVRTLNDLDTVAARWLEQADYSGLKPVTGSADSSLFSLMLANDSQVRGWLRSSTLAPPDWSSPPLPAIPMTVSLLEPAADGDWTVTFTPPNGESLAAGTAYSRNNVLYLTTPPGFTSLAFVAMRKPR